MFLRGHPLCEECLRYGKVTPATDVHHKDGNVENTNEDNLEALCHSCHSRHTAKKQAFGKGRGM